MQDEGLLSKKRWEVYKALYASGPCTAGELFSKSSGLVKGSVCARLTELREQGVVKEIGLKKCSFTGNSVILWDVTNQLPIKYKKDQNTLTRKHLLKCREALIEVYKDKRTQNWQRELIVSKFLGEGV
jgi:DNA-binding transcriptional regulator GbsR (MarR family)